MGIIYIAVTFIDYSLLAVLAESAKMAYPGPFDNQRRGLTIDICVVRGKVGLSGIVNRCVEQHPNLRNNAVVKMGYAASGSVHFFVSMVAVGDAVRYQEEDKARLNFLPGDGQVEYENSRCDPTNAIRQLRDRCGANGCPAGISVKCGGMTAFVTGDYQGNEWKSAFFSNFERIYREARSGYTVNRMRRIPQSHDMWDWETDKIPHTRIPEKVKISVYQSSHSNAAMLGSMTIHFQANKVVDGGCHMMRAAFNTCLGFLPGGFALVAGAARGIAGMIKCG